MAQPADRTDRNGAVGDDWFNISWPQSSSSAQTRPELPHEADYPADYGVAQGAPPQLRYNAQRMSANDYRQRCIALAYEYHTNGTLRYIDTDPYTGEHVYATAARGWYNQAYLLRFNFTRGAVSCNCESYRAGLPCAHIGAALLVLEQIRTAVSPQGQRSQRQYERFTDELERRGW